MLSTRHHFYRINRVRTRFSQFLLLTRSDSELHLIALVVLITHTVFITFLKYLIAFCIGILVVAFRPWCAIFSL